MRQYLYFCANECFRICAFRTSKSPLSRATIGVGVPDEAARLLRQYLYFCNSKASKLSTWRSPLDHFRGFHTNSHYYCQRRRPASHRPADLKKKIIRKSRNITYCRPLILARKKSTRIRAWYLRALIHKQKGFCEEVLQENGKKNDLFSSWISPTWDLLQVEYWDL